MSEIDDRLSPYDLGPVRSVEPLLGGAVEENRLVRTASGDHVLRRYVHRSRPSVEYELRLLDDLAAAGVACVPALADRDGRRIASLGDRPAALFPFVRGRSPRRLEGTRLRAVVDVVAAIHRTTRDDRRYDCPERWNYTREFCRERLEHAASRSPREDAGTRLSWLLDRLDALELPSGLPRGVCHADLGPGNLLFDGDELVALLDFDDANFTWLAFDLVNLMDHACWSGPTDADWAAGARLVAEYDRRRPLVPAEREHLWDVHRFEILLDAAWCFERGTAEEFPERRRLELLDSLGREEYARRLGLG